MNTFRYEVKLVIEVEAFDEADAWDAIQDTYGVGSDCGVTVLECEYREAGKRGKR